MHWQSKEPGRGAAQCELAVQGARGRSGNSQERSPGKARSQGEERLNVHLQCKEQERRADKCLLAEQEARKKNGLICTDSVRSQKEEQLNVPLQSKVPERGAAHSALAV